MPYTKTTWQNFPSPSSPLNATNMNKIENGIATAQALAETAKATADEALADGGGGSGVGVTVGPTPPTNGFWVESATSAVGASAVTFSDLSGTGSDTYTIPTVAHVEYRVGGVAKAAGTYAGVGTVTVTAHALDGYILLGTSSWSHTFATTASPTSVTPTAPTFDDAADTYVIPTTTGVDYRISGAIVAAGTYPVTAPAAVAITATAQSGYVLTGTTSWGFDFAADPYVPFTPPGSTILMSDSFTGSGNAESRTTDSAWGGSPVTPVTGVAGSHIVTGDLLDPQILARLRYNVAGSQRAYIGLKTTDYGVLSATAVNVHYNFSSTGTTGPGIKFVRSSGLDKAQLLENTTVKYVHNISPLDEVGLSVDGTVVKMWVNGVVVHTDTTAWAAGTFHGFQAYGDSPPLFSDFIIAALA